MKKITLFLFAIFTMSLGLSQTVFGDKQTISTTGSGPYNIASGLINNDTYPDFVAGTFFGGTIELFLNDNSGGFSNKILVTNTLSNVAYLDLADLNSDTFPDIVATDGFKIVWFPNDGNGAYSSEIEISSDFSGISNFEFGFIDNNNSLDLVISDYDGNMVVWYSNDGSGNFIPGDNIIDDTVSSPSKVRLKDIDGDGDNDILLLSSVVPTNVSPNPNIIELFRNNRIENGDGTVSFSKAQNTVGNNKIYLWDAIFEDKSSASNRTFFVTDFGYSGIGTGSLYRYDDNGFGYIETEIPAGVPNPSTILLIDLDGDTSKDILIGSGSAGSTGNLAWFKNNGNSYGSSEIIDNTQSAVYALTSEDFDQDGDMDIVSLSYNNNTIYFVENLLETLSTPDLTQEEFNFYPNPVTNRLNFSVSNMISAKLRISDITGKIVFNNTVELTHGIDVSNLQKGVYVLSVNNTSNYKFVKN